MTWTAPPVFVAGNTLTAAQLNILSTDLNETGAGKATAAGQFFVSTGVNALAARAPGSDVAYVSEATTSTTITDLTTVGPIVTVTTGSSALTLLNASIANNTVNGTSTIVIDISGATTVTGSGSLIPMSFTSATVGQQATVGAVRMSTGLNSGSNTFKMMYGVSAGTTGTFNRRHLTVLPF
jgi:hypothetical protein